MFLEYQRRGDRGCTAPRPHVLGVSSWGRYRGWKKRSKYWARGGGGGSIGPHLGPVSPAPGQSDLGIGLLVSFSSILHRDRPNLMEKHAFLGIPPPWGEGVHRASFGPCFAGAGPIRPRNRTPHVFFIHSASRSSKFDGKHAFFVFAIFRFSVKTSKATDTPNSDPGDAPDRPRRSPGHDPGRPYYGASPMARVLRFYFTSTVCLN